MATVVCLHGLGRTAADWAAVRDGLRAATGGGDVLAPALPHDADAAFRVARAAIDAAVDGPVVLVGHSMGAVLALRLAAGGTAQGGVRAVVLTNGFFPPARDGRSTAATAADYAAHRVAFVRAAVARRRAGAAPAAGGRPGAGLGALAGLALRRDGWRGLVSGVTAPVLVLHAPDDHHVPIAFARAAARANDWPLRELAGGGHHAHVTRPGAWLAAVVPWLAG